jgi:hypothetical protein
VLRGPLDKARGKEAGMKNVELSIEGTTLTIKVDLSKEFGPSASGKTILVATTEGNVTVPGRQEKIGLNVYRKKP